mgnify:FL=1
MSTFFSRKWAIDRRTLLGTSSIAVAGAAIAPLLPAQAKAQSDLTSATAAKAGHHKPRVKSVIFLHMVGGHSHLDMFE